MRSILAKPDLFAQTKHGDRFEQACQLVVDLHHAGHEAYLVGGCVRDRLLGLDPSDFDVATSATPDEVQAVFPAAMKVGAAFGVMLVRANGVLYEIATFRSDGTYSDGRRPDSVEFTTAEEDVARRDFTINGLLYDTAAGTVFDFVGGVEDLEQRVLRTIGDPQRRFSEDYLRVLRGVRFAARFNLEVEPRTSAALMEQAPQLVRLAPERIKEEWFKLFGTSKASVAIALLIHHGVDQVLLHDIMQVPGVLRRHTAWQRLAEANVASMSPESALLMLILSTPARHNLDEMGRRLRLSRESLDRLHVQAELWDALVSERSFREANFIRQIRREAWPEMLRLADATASLPERSVVAIQTRAARYRDSEEGRALLRPEPLLAGKDLIDWGLQPGPRFKTLLHELETEQLEQRVTSAAAAQAWLAKKLKKS